MGSPNRVPRVLVVDDEPLIRKALRRMLTGLGCEVAEADDGVDAMAKLGAASFELVITDLRMPRADGFAVVRAVRTHHPKTAVVMLTASGSLADCVNAMRAGALNFLSKPFSEPELAAVLREVQAGAAPERPDRPQATLIGRSPRLHDVLELVERVARSDATTLITGESGTGKEVVARLVHVLSPRAGKPFVPVNCGAIPEGLVESELFGHARGSFTGATEKRTGRFAAADGGTIFLDEIGELPLAVQVKLLRVLQEREVTPVGESKSQRVDVRVVAATNRDLEALVASGGFREDLWFRLNVLPIEMPALRERRADIRHLAEHFLQAANARTGRVATLAPRTLELMEAWSWPGNVRELENLIERLVVMSPKDEIPPDVLPPKMRGEATPVPSRAPVTPPGGTDLLRALDDTEWRMIDDALARAEGNKAKAAALLGIKRTTLVEKLKRRRQGP